MNYSQLSSTSITDYLTLNSKNPIIVHIVPDFNELAADTLFINGLNLLNCHGIVSPSKNIKLGIKTFNTRRIFLSTKAKLSDKEVLNANKVIPVFQNYPDKISETLSKNNQFLIVDHSVLSQASQYILNQTHETNVLYFLFQQLKNEYSIIKKNDPKCENIILFTLNSQDNNFGNILLHLNKFNSKLLNVLTCYDKFILTSICSADDPKIFPIVGYKSKSGIPEIYKSNLNIIRKYYSSIKSTSTPPVQSKDDEQSTNNLPVNHNQKSELHNKLQDLNINTDKLQQWFKKYNIRDRSISNNIKQAIVDYVDSSPTSEIDKTDLEKIILLSINKTIFNTDIIDPHYINNPEKLISKLEEFNTYSKELHYPKTVDDYILEPSKTIDLKRVTGLVRHKYEFSDNIHKNIEVLFNELENRPTDPVKVIDIKHTYEDNNLNRLVNYEVTLKNLTGKNKKPYKVNVKIPSLVNDRYFKLNGKNYILSNQQFFVPITKTEPDECRLINSYQTLTLSIVNLKINISEISKFIQYIQTRYPNKIINIEKDINKNVLRAKLKDENDKDCTIDLTSNLVFDSQNLQFKFDTDLNRWVEIQNGEQKDSSLGKCEFLFDKLEKILQSANPQDNVKKSQKAIPYLVIHLMALKIPLIVYMWQQLGLTNSLHRLNIDYSFSNNPDPNSTFTMSLSNGKYLSIFTKSKRQELIVNGLYTIDFNKYKFKDENDLADKHSIDQFLLDKDTRSLVNLDLLTANVLDTWTRDILETNGNSTNIIDLLSVDMVDKLLNDQPDQLSDLKIYRNRQAEVIFTLLYRMLMMSHRLYSSEQKFKDDAKIFLSENYVVECLLGINPHMKGSAAIEMVNPYSPITELKAASKLIKTGPRGLPNKRMIKLQHRNIHPSYFGNIGANASTEYADVGVVNRLGLTPLLSDKYGSYGTKDIKNVNGWEVLSLDESLIPFINEMQSDRAVLAYTHRAQITPIKDGEVPIVCTGAEFVVPQLASNRFVNIAKRPGEVLEVKQNEYLKIKYDNGELEYIDISPRLANTKRSSYISLDMQTKPIGYKFDENELLSWTNSFNGDAYTAGRNLTLALMNYDGLSHEDSYVISEKTASKFVTQSLKEISAIIPLNSKVFQMVTEYKNTNPGDVILEFGYAGLNIEQYLDEFEVLDEDSDESENAIYNYIGNNVQLTSPGGEISEIRIYINNKNQIDPSILQIWKKMCARLKTKAKLYEYGKTTDREKIAALDNLDMSQLKTGNHKVRGKVFEGARIVFYIKTDRELGEGDKICNRFGAKGIVGTILKDDETPYTDYSGKIDIFLSPFGLAGRKNLVVIKELYLGKILYFLPKIIKEKLKVEPIDKIKELILSIYELLDNSKDKKYYNLINDKLTELIKKKTLKTELETENLKFILMCEPFHNNIPLDNMQQAANILGIPLDEKIYIPKYKCYTKTKVPVGINFFQAMEQIAEEYESLRSTGKYKFSTGQPEKGKVNIGGQSLGNWDIYSLLTCDVPNVMKELMTVRSDDFKNKREMTMHIIENGEAQIPKEVGDAATKDLYKIHMIALGLSPN